MKTYLIFLMLMTSWLSSSFTAYGQGLKTLEELTRSAPVIVTGTVQDVWTETGEYLGRDDFIFTFIDVAIQNVLKGKEKEQIRIKVLGGKFGSRVITGKRHIPFAPGEVALLFLSPTTQNQYEVYSPSGKLLVVRKETENHFDTAMLRKDDISDYGYQSSARTDNILSRINQYLTHNGGNE